MQNELFFIIFSVIAMFFGYNLQLEKRTLKLEKKNGHEQSVLDFLEKENKVQQHQIDELKKKVAELNNTVALLENKDRDLEQENQKLRQELALFKALLQKYTSEHKLIKN